MIAYVRGSVASVSAGSAVVEVGGVGLELQCAPGPWPGCGSATRPRSRRRSWSGRTP